MNRRSSVRKGASIRIETPSRGRPCPGAQPSSDNGPEPEGEPGADGQTSSDGRPEPPVRGARFPHEVLAVVLQVRQGSLHVLLWQRAEPPFEGRWALPGGPLGEDERL